MNMTPRVACLFCLLGSLSLAFILLAATPVSAQIASASMSGSVTDQTGAAIPGADVVVTNTETGVSRSTRTNNSGEYSITFLPVGTYKLEVRAKGFRSSIQSGIVLSVERNARVHAVLRPGAVDTAVTVVGDASPVNVQNSSVGTNVGTQEIQNLPLVNRDAYSFLSLVPGVQDSTSNNTLGFPEQKNRINGSENSLSGDLGGQTGYLLDGGLNTSGYRGTGNAAPNPDAIQEFRVITNNYSAEYGRYSGGVIDLVTKSGTNSLHGSLFEFLRNDALNARPWGLSPTKHQPPLRRNQFGATIGGPIHHDRTFFFASFSGLRQLVTNATTSTLPTAAELNGDFSALLTGSSPTQIIDPASTAKYPANVFPGNVIPANRFDPVAVGLLKFLPSPNLGDQLLSFPQTSTDTNEYLVKVDHSLTPRHQLSVSYFHPKGSSSIPQGDIPGWVRQATRFSQHNLTASDTWTITPTIFNQVRVNYVRNIAVRTNLPAINPLHSLGSTFDLQGIPSPPGITVNGFFRLGGSITIPGPFAGSQTYIAKDVISMTRGRHSLQFGAEGSLDKLGEFSLLDNFGIFTFDGSKTRAASGTKLPAGTKTGNAFADFLLGIPLSLKQDQPISKADNTWYWGAFVNDDFRVLPRLTLNLGLRYDIQLPPTDTQNQAITFKQGVQSTVDPFAPLGVLFPGDRGVPRGLIPARKAHFSPRLGFAWDVTGDGKTAIRGGAGLFYGTMSANIWNQPADHQPFGARLTLNNIKSLSNIYGNLTGGDPFPIVFNPRAPFSPLPAQIFPIDPHFQWPYSYNANLSIQRQVTNTINFTVGYVGSFGHDAPLAFDANYPTLNPVDLARLGIATPTTANINTRRPILPGTLGSITMIKSMVSSGYHGLQVTGEKRMSHGFSVRGHYTFSKTLDNMGAVSTIQDLNNLAAERGRSGFDRRHTAVITTIWQIDYLPPATGWRRIANAVANGWTLSTISTLRSGSPLNITSGVDNNFDGSSSGDRPNVVFGIDPVLDPHRSRGRITGVDNGGVRGTWFNTAAFVQPVPGTFFGNSSRNTLEGPGAKSIDVAFLRTFNITERTKLQFRMEMTNAFNFVNLDNPNTSVNSSNFGKISGAGAARQLQLGLRLAF